MNKEAKEGTVDLQDIPAEKQVAIALYYRYLLKKHPQWPTAKLLKKTGEHFDIQFVFKK